MEHLCLEACENDDSEPVDPGTLAASDLRLSPLEPQTRGYNNFLKGTGHDYLAALKVELSKFC